MSLNCIEIEEIIKYFPDSCIIKNIYQTDKYSLLIHMYDKNNDYLIAGSIQDKYNRINLVNNKINIKNNKHRFSQLLNSELSGARIINIYQYEYSRVVVFEIQGLSFSQKLIFRLWGTGSNIILADNDNRIIDCIRRMPARGEWPGEYFEFPCNKTAQIENKFSIRDQFKDKNINNAVFSYYDSLIKNELITQKKKTIKNILEKEIKIYKKKLKDIEKHLSEDREDKYKKYGDLLTANIYAVKKGEKKIALTDYETNREITIPLIENITPAQNANRYYSRYKKIKKGRLNWEKEQKKTREKLENLEFNLLQLDEINEIDELINLEQILDKKNRDNNSKEKALFRMFKLDNDFNAYVSKSAKDSQKMLKKIACGNDYWFHIRDYAGSHVVVKYHKDKEISENAKNKASLLAVYFSKGRNDEYADVYFTQVKYLHKSKGGPAGLVFPTQEKNISVKSNNELLQEILNNKLI